MSGFSVDEYVRWEMLWPFVENTLYYTDYTNPAPKARHFIDTLFTSHIPSSSGSCQFCPESTSSDVMVPRGVTLAAVDELPTANLEASEQLMRPG